MRWSRTLPVALLTLAALAGCAPTPAPTPTPTAAADTAPCEGASGVGGAVPAGLGPGDLVTANDLTDANVESAGFPTGARVWRILYVTTGVDETDLQLVCGTVAAPEAGPALFGDAGRILNWSHGTVGIDEDCMPSTHPATGFWGPMPGGINTIAWGTGLGRHEGEASGGLLQWALDAGMLVAATDYQPDSTYVVGKMEASAVLDAARAATQLANETFTDAPKKYDAVIWGHSQGGHAALWAGQLAETYWAGTAPSKPTASLELVGVAALAPASNFITQAGQPGVQPGDGLADWEMHKNIGLDLPIDSVQMQIGPALFSYIFGSWDALASGRAPASDATFPAYPTSVPPVELASIATATGSQTVSQVSALCLTAGQAKEVQGLVEKYGDAKTNQMVIPPIWNLPADYTTNDYFHGALDKACIDTVEAGLESWCEWMRFNLPGPLGTNPYPKAPIVNGTPAPLFIAQGVDDDIIHCQPSAETPAGEIPDAANCMSRALYESLASEIYCPATGPAGFLELHAVLPSGPDGIDSAATHFSIPGEISAKTIGSSAADLSFEGSPLQKFMTAAFERSTVSGCSTSVS